MDLTAWYQGQTSRLPALPESLMDMDPFEFMLETLETGDTEKLIPPDFPPSYSSFTKTISGKERTLYDPNKSMRIITRSFQNGVLARLNFFLQLDEFSLPMCKKRLQSFISLPSSFAYKNGSSLEKVFVQHKKGQYFYVVDLKSAYQNVDLALLATLITSLLLSRTSSALLLFSHVQNILYQKAEDIFVDDEYTLYKRILSFIRKFCTLEHEGIPGILLGSTISTWLFNIYCEGLIDLPIKTQLYRLYKSDVTFTRYGDDLIFSTQNPNRINKKKIAEVVEKVFEINQKKVRSANIEVRQIKVLGFSIDASGRVVFPTKKRNKLHVLMHKSMLDIQNKKKRYKALGFINHFYEYIKINEGNLTESDRTTLNKIREFKGYKQKFRRR